ncbi:MAG: hypothetical protein [Podoviridae sp. ctDWo9]|nr:MAG: hypothetical protein [Podoviridae sp. ctDWo9]
MNSRNSVPAYAAYGKPVTGYRLSAAGNGQSKLLAGGGEYVGRNRCMANDDTCEGPRAQGTDYCIGHLRNRRKTEGS